ncbi:MAG: universal stress protein [Paludibacteraceae bacterium]|nr:universal stress protein [Paludibacteraceae bacterium]
MVFLYISDVANPNAEFWTRRLTNELGKTFEKSEADDIIELRDPDVFSEWLQQRDVDLVFISCENEKRIIQRFLNACRSLRIPYLFCTDTMAKLSVLAKYEPALHEVLAPVTRLEEEVYKAEILSVLRRYTLCKITLLEANDYGSRAVRNTERILKFIEDNAKNDNENTSPAVRKIKAVKSSDALYREISDRQRELVPDMVVMTASREYGLDDLLFGPAERHVICKSQVPVLLLNPRDDLFSLCD